MTKYSFSIDKTVKTKYEIKVCLHYPIFRTRKIDSVSSSLKLFLICPYSCLDLLNFLLSLALKLFC